MRGARFKLFASLAITALAGCHANEKTPAVGTMSTTPRVLPNTSAAQPAKTPKPHKPPKDKGELVRRVRCLYDQKPWLNLDVPGDRNPEGVRFRAFLDTGSGYGVIREGTLHVDMYKITHNDQDNIDRTLISDWHYPTQEVHRIKSPGMLGEGYFLYLVWAQKDIAGSEIEIVVSFEDAEGNIARSGTKRLSVPKYTT